MTDSLPILPQCCHRGDVVGDRVACRSNRLMHPGTVPLAFCATCRWADMPLLTLPAKRPQPVPAPTEGPGTELRRLLEELGLHESAGCQCDQHAAQMNRWGIDGCREHRPEIVVWLKDAQTKAGTWDLIAAAGRAIVRMLPIDPRDIYGSLIDIAISRSGTE